MAYNVAGSSADPSVAVSHVLQVTSAKAKLTKNNHIRLTLSITVIEGAATGFTFFQDLWLVHATDAGKTRQWMSQAGKIISLILGYEPDPFDLPSEAGEETHATKLLVGATFQSMLKIRKGTGEFADSFQLGKIIGPVDADYNGDGEYTEDVFPIGDSADEDLF